MRDQKKQKHPCFGISVKLWVTRRKFYWFPRMGPKYILSSRDKTRNLRVNDLPYSAWIFIWLWLDITLYWPKITKDENAEQEKTYSKDTSPEGKTNFKG